MAKDLAVLGITRFSVPKRLAERRRLKMVNVSGAPYWLRSVHAGNDSKDPFAGYLDGCLGPAELDRAMHEHFPHIDTGRLARALGPGSRNDIR